MKGLLIVLTTLFSLATNAKLLLVGDSEHPPYSYLDGDELKGVYYEIVSQALKDYDVDITIELHPWKRALKMVELGKADGIFPPHYFPTKRPFISTYSDQVLQENVAVFCSGDDKLDDLSWPQDFTNKTFVLSQGVKMGGDEFWSAVDNKQIDAFEVEGPEEALMMLSKGRADCHINDMFTLLWHQKVMGESSDTLQEMKILSSSGGHLGLAAHLPLQDAQKLLSYFNQQLSEMSQQGITQVIIDRNTVK